MKVTRVVHCSNHVTIERIVFECPENVVDLGHFAFGVFELQTMLIAVGFAEATIFVCPSVLDVETEVVDVV